MLKNLKDYFEKRDDVLMAFLFGSYAKSMPHIESDIDIAVYFRTKSNRLEWEEFDIKYEGDNLVITYEFEHFPLKLNQIQQVLDEDDGEPNVWKVKDKNGNIILWREISDPLRQIPFKLVTSIYGLDFLNK